MDPITLILVLFAVAIIALMALGRIDTTTALVLIFVAIFAIVLLRGGIA